MELLGAVDAGGLQADPFLGLVTGILKLVAYGAAGVVLVGVVATWLCDIFECRKWRQSGGRTETWKLMH